MVLSAIFSLFSGGGRHQYFSHFFLFRPGGPKTYSVAGLLVILAQSTHPRPFLYQDRKKGVITKGVFSLLQSLKSLNSLESLENGRISPLFSTVWGFSKISRTSNLNKQGESAINLGNFRKLCQISLWAIYLFMLGWSVASKFIYVGPVGGPESTSNNSGQS